MLIEMVVPILMLAGGPTHIIYPNPFPRKPQEHVRTKGDYTLQLYIGFPAQVYRWKDGEGGGVGCARPLRFRGGLRSVAHADF